jgi:TPP-dependent indolepyruvate ferredoxin oxidoreductase alpha subunit
MYEHIGRRLIENGARLVYVADRSMGASLRILENQFPSFHCEVATNEKVAFELAFTGAVTSKKSACIFSTEDLYEALDPVMTSSYMGVVGGFLLVCVRETMEEVGPVGPFSKLPLMVVEGYDALDRAITFGYDASERYRIPFIIEFIPDGGAAPPGPHEKAVAEAKPARFVKEPLRWAALPKSRYRLHGELNEKIERIRREFEDYKGNTVTIRGRTGVITDRTALEDFSGDDPSVFHVETLFPLPLERIRDFIDGMDRVTVSEGPYPVMELQIRDRQKIGLRCPAVERDRVKKDETMYGFHVVRDELGPASSINMAHGISIGDPRKRVLAITWEDHFFHSGMPAFINTLYNGSSYVLLIMTRDKEEEIIKMLGNWGFRNSVSIENVSEVARFNEASELTVLFCRGIV